VTSRKIQEKLPNGKSKQIKYIRKYKHSFKNRLQKAQSLTNVKKKCIRKLI